MKKIDASCDRFETEWKAGRKPTIERHLGSATGTERAELLRTLLRLELDLQGPGVKSRQATYEARFPHDTAIVQSVFRDMSERTTSHRAAASLETSVSKESARLPGARAFLPESTPNCIGRFEIVEVLGQGAFGRVYKARDPQLDRHVAIKVPLRSALGSQDEIDRFLREARAAATLHHPNLCPVHEVGQDENGAHYIVMAYVDGKTLSAFLKERKEPVAAKQAAIIVRKLAVALGAAHGKGIVHRDLKPSNIMIERERKDVIVMDFGLARHRSSGDTKETCEGVVMGTPAYMSPEQARGDVKTIGPAADIYSVGVILYEMLAGKVPFSGSLTEILGKVLHVEPAPPSSQRAGVDPQLEAICMKAIAKAPADRFTSMKALTDALDGFLKGVPSESVIAKPRAKGRAADSSIGLTQVVEAMSAERKKEHKALAKSVGRQSLVLLTIGLAAFGVLGCLMFAGIIVFFFRTPTTLVQVTLVTKIDQRLLDDRTISFFFDEKLLTAEELNRPINLTPGKHVLQARRGDVVVQEVILMAGGEGNNAKIEVTTTVEYNPSPDKVATSKQPPDGWVWLFDEQKVLEEWDGLPGYWRFKDGDLIGTSKGIKHNTFLCSRRSYKDFELKFQVKLTGQKANSGVQIRSAMIDASRLVVKGPQADMGDAFWGSLYGELFGGMMHQGPKELVEKILKKDDFNDYYIKCAGKHVTIKLNGQATVDGEFPAMPNDGMLAWQIHAGPPMDVVFRNILFRDVGDGITLFNGKDLAGWKNVNGAPAAWKVENGYVEVVPGKGSIMTELVFPLDFELHAEFWLPRLPGKTGQGRANSGIYLHGRHEIQILDMVDNPNVKPEQGCAALYGVIPPRPGGIKPPETWQTFDITYHSPRKGADAVLIPGRLTVIHNGVLVIDNAPFASVVSGGAQNTNVGQPGPIVLQDHGTAVRFRNLKLRPLTPPAKAEAGFTPLFNGKDLTGWKTHPSQGGAWKVQDGFLTGSGPMSHLFSERGDFQDFHARADFRVNAKGNSGLFFRTEFGLTRVPAKFPDGYEVQILHRDPPIPGNTTGTLVRFTQGKDTVINPNEWATMDVNVQGNHFVIKVNGATTVDFIDQKNTYTSGHFALQLMEAGSVVQFRKIEVKELAPAETGKLPK